jgi:hypothetical protein
MSGELQVADFPRTEYDGYFEFTDLNGDGHSEWRGRVVRRSTNGLYLETFGTKDEVQGRVRGAMLELKRGVEKTPDSPVETMVKVLTAEPAEPPKRKSLMERLFG